MQIRDTRQHCVNGNFKYKSGKIRRTNGERTLIRMRNLSENPGIILFPREQF
jgi:hypothetical protein